MTIKFSSKEIHFLKTDSDDFTIKPPETFFSDLLTVKTAPINSFEKRLAETALPEKKCIVAVLQISGAPSPAREKAGIAFEKTVNSLLDHGRGIWESLNPTSFALALWDFSSEDKASRLLISLKSKLSSALKADILTGVAKFPFHDFSIDQTLANALKAIDHAAFFGPDTLIHFDAVSLNISGDRLYQLGKFDAAIKEYRKGLDIKPGDINLINSLGVCFGVMGKLELAKKEFETAAKINPNEVMVIYNIGLIYRIEGDMEKAVMYLRRAHGIDDQVFEVELVLGLTLFKKGNPDQAMPHLEAATRINPKSGLAFRVRGDIYLLDNLPEQAALEFNRAIKLNPSDAVSLSGYAKSLALQEKNLNIALTFARNSIDLEPDNTLFRQRFKIIQQKIEAATLQDDHIKTA